MPTTETLDSRRDGPVLRLTLSRPDVLNAIDGRMLVELRHALREAERDGTATGPSPPASTWPT